MTIPTVHLNGTSAEQLVEQYAQAAHAVDTALEAVAQSAPNGRDYYVKPGSFDAARTEHDARLAKLRDVRDELQALALAILGDVR